MTASLNCTSPLGVREKKQLGVRGQRAIGQKCYDWHGRNGGPAMRSDVERLPCPRRRVRSQVSWLLGRLAAGRSESN